MATVISVRGAIYFCRLMEFQRPARIRRNEEQPESEGERDKAGKRKG